MNRFNRAASAALLLLSATFGATGTTLRVEIPAGRSVDTWDSYAEPRVKDVNNRLGQMTDPMRLLRKDATEFSIPTRVVLTQHGVALDHRPDGREAGDISLQFAPSGERAFPAEYRTFLESVYNAAKPAMDAVFGQAVTGGAVKVHNYDADIQARLAVSGGYYVHNAPGGPEVRFPIYQSAASAGVNFIHTLLLAYLADRQYPFDAYNEGLVRAATMTIARTPGAIPGVSAESIEATLDSLYDASAFYMWSNRPGLGAPTFIAPNLLNDPLPAGGSTGGVYLLRYQMAGTAWAKILAEYPGFIRRFNEYYTANPTGYQTAAMLEALGQFVLNEVSGQPSATIESFAFRDWAFRQQVLDTRLNPGLKLVPQAFPISPTPGSSDFGVFGIVLHAFRTDPSANETLLNGRSFPIFWRPDNARFFAAAQDDVINVNGGYGSVVPNFPSDLFSSQVYRVGVDLPFQGKNVRVYLPAGAIATGSNATPNNVFGTLTGFASGIDYRVNIEWLGGTLTNVPVRNMAFGGTAAASFDNAQPITVRVFSVVGSTVTEVRTLRVNKGRGAVGLDVRSTDSDVSFVFSRQNRLAMVGIPFDPYRPNPADVLGLPDNQTLVARFNPFRNAYDYYPVEGEFRQGLGYFTRATQQSGVQIQGQTSARTPLSVHLQAGWNMVTVPSLTAVNKTALSVTATNQGVGLWNQAVGTLVGNAIFTFNPDPVNPDAGTLVEATVMEPGKAYFVRALQPDGAVLVFPNGGAAPQAPQRSAGEASNPLGPELLGKGGSTSVNAWRSRITLTSTANHYAAVEVGQQTGAVYGFNAKEDDHLAPGPGGHQLVVLNNGPYYRDIRPLKKGDRYAIQLNGLQAGVVYRLNSQSLLSNARFRVYGLGHPQWLSASEPIQFTATGQTMWVELDVQ